MVASTTSTPDPGLFEYLLPIFKQKTGITVKVLAQGTGQAHQWCKRVIGYSTTQSICVLFGAACGAGQSGQSETLRGVGERRRGIGCGARLILRTARRRVSHHRCSLLRHAALSHRRLCSAEAPAGDLAVLRIRGRRRADQLWAQRRRELQERRNLCRPDPQGGKASRPAGAPGDQIRFRDQLEDGQGARTDGATDAAHRSRRGDRIRCKCLLLAQSGHFRCAE